MLSRTLKISNHNKINHKVSKFKLIKLSFGTTCRKMQGNIITKFHRAPKIETNSFFISKKQLNAFIESKAAPYINILKLQFISNITPKKSHLFSHLNFLFRLDWERRRFKGEVVSIVVNKGKITEKVYITPKGSVIKVIRKELGIFSTFFS